MTDLIARLEEHIAMHEEGVREQDDAKLCLCVLANNLSAIIHALKVQQAAEAYVQTQITQYPSEGAYLAAKWDAEKGLLQAVKGEQP